MFGVGLGLAILIDVLIVRLVIAPAVVTLLGDKAWWFPKWLDALLPEVPLEGKREPVAAGPAGSGLTDGVEFGEPVVVEPDEVGDRRS